MLKQVQHDENGGARDGVLKQVQRGGVWVV
jgi:hypothetical protein